MAKVIVPQFTKADFAKIIKKDVATIQSRIEYFFLYLGELCLAEMRSSYSYIDRTGNLTSSMGYVVLNLGRIVKISGFDFSLEGGGIGQDEIMKIANDYSQYAYVLICIAGMEYSVYVQSRGFNVIGSAELLAEREMPKIVQKITR